MLARREAVADEIAAIQERMKQLEM
jgi:hypothetical protein